MYYEIFKNGSCYIQHPQYTNNEEKKSVMIYIRVKAEKYGVH